MSIERKGSDQPEHGTDRLGTAVRNGRSCGVRSAREVQLDLRRVTVLRLKHGETLTDIYG